ncbi:MAG TPA: hypothetical protein VFL94_14695 [Actinomycetales bacterium]|nr:hypothetical protein [Actinomycetales bacterium]
MMAQIIPAAAAGRYVTWGVVSVSITNLLIIVVMIVVFVLALVIPFPSQRGDGDHVMGARHEVGDGDAGRPS